MAPLIEQHREQIAQLCKKYGVKKLELFGSAARDDFDPTTSDVDFFYEFEGQSYKGIARRFFSLKDDLESLLRMKVDLVSAVDVRNPYFLEAASRERTTLYAA